jgi:peroxiredoxin
MMPLRQTIFLLTSNPGLKLMMILMISVLALTCSPRISLTGAKQFTLKGRTNSLPDGTMLYLTESISNQIADSIQVSSNRFHAKGHLEASPTNFYLHTADFAEYVSLWIESGHMTFDATDADFKNAIITGSRTQAEAKDFLQAIASIDSDDMVETEQLAIEFVKAYPANRLSASMLAGYAPEWGKAKVEELFVPFSQDNKESVYGQRISQYIALNKDHQIGDHYTDFEMENTAGEPIKLSDHLGKVTLLEFWASWCGPCRERSPELRETYKKYNAQGFEIIGISLDFSKEQWEKAIATDSLYWPQVSDLKGRNSLAGIIYGVNAIPDNYLIGPDGKIIGEYLWGEDLNLAVEQALK